MTMPQDLSGAVVLVTGAGGGLGGAICAAARDARAVVVGTDLGEPPSFVETDAWLPHDVTSMDAWIRVISEIRGRFGRLDCLVNNAGISLSETIANTSLDQWRRVLSVNLESVFLSMKAALPLLLESGRTRPGGSSVVNLSSTAGLRGSPFSAAYGASKGAVSLLTKTAAKEFGALGYPIRVNSVYPGAVETAMLQTVMQRQVDAGFVRSAEELKASWSNISALKRLGQPREIAGGVVFLCSPAASFVTGAELVIDGGALA